MKKIPLTQGLFTLVDDADYGWLNQWKWHASEVHRSFYAKRMFQNRGDRRVIRMHREILGLSHKDGKQGDHVDGNGLNNQRSNLRICTNQQNHWNMVIQNRPKSSKFKGVYQSRKSNKWTAQIGHNGKNWNLGNFESEIEAAKAYDKNAIELFGEFARLNFPKSGDGDGE